MKLQTILPEYNHGEDLILKDKGISICAFLDTVRPRKDKSNSVRLRIVYKRYPKYYSTSVNMSEEDWLRMVGPKPRDTLKDTKVVIKTLLNEAKGIILSMDEFSFESFDKKYYGRSSKDDVFGFYSGYIAELKKDQRIGNSTVYEYSQKSLQEYRGQKSMSFKEVTPGLLKKWERSLISKGKSLTTVGMYMRCLRFLYNQAIKAGIARKEHYPFGQEKDGKYTIPQPRNIKKSLKLVDIGKIFNYKPVEDSPEHYYRDLWLFSYLSNGIGMKDLCLLKYKNIKGDHLYFTRSKTALTNRRPKQIDVILTDEIRQIIERWGSKPVSPDRYLFPVLEDHLTADQEQARVKQLTKQVNKYIKRIAKSVGITQNISTYSARHSFASILKRSGVNVSYISDSLGHTDIKTTENYLDSFEDEQKREIAKKLIDW